MGRAVTGSAHSVNSNFDPYVTCCPCLKRQNDLSGSAPLLASLSRFFISARAEGRGGEGRGLGRDIGGDGGSNGPGCGGEGLRGALLPDIRHQPGGARGTLPGRLYAHLRGRQDPGRRGHRRKAYVSPLPAVRARHLHRRLPAFRPRRRHASLRQRFPSARWRVARTQVQSDVSTDANTPRKLLCAE